MSSYQMEAGSGSICRVGVRGAFGSGGRQDGKSDNRAVGVQQMQALDWTSVAIH